MSQSWTFEIDYNLKYLFCSFLLNNQLMTNPCNLYIKCQINLKQRSAQYFEATICMIIIGYFCWEEEEEEEEILQKPHVLCCQAVWPKMLWTWYTQFIQGVTAKCPLCYSVGLCRALKLQVSKCGHNIYITANPGS